MSDLVSNRIWSNLLMMQERYSRAVSSQEMSNTLCNWLCLNHKHSSSLVVVFLFLKFYSRNFLSPASVIAISSRYYNVGHWRCSALPIRTLLAQYHEFVEKFLESMKHILRMKFHNTTHKLSSRCVPQILRFLL